MGILGRLFGPKAPAAIEDPELGRVERAGKHWSLEVAFDGFAAPVHVLLSGTEAGPSAAAKVALGELRTRLRGMLDGPAAEHLHRAEAESAEDAGLPPPDRDAIFQVYALDGIRVDVAGGTTHVELSFRPSWSESHDVHCHFVDWKPSGLGVDS